MLVYHVVAETYCYGDAAAGSRVNLGATEMGDVAVLLRRAA